MSICDPCLRAKPLPNCIQELTIGTLSLLNSNVSVYIQDVTTGQITLLSGTTNGAGELSVDISGKKFMDTHSYDLWVTDSGADFEDRLDITIGSSVNNTVCLRFESVVSVEGESEMFVSQTIIEA